ncbi:hypothetical protein ACFC1B_26990 [Streptomyces xiamenensis]|uniref:hypothetical protein n=1 Tax=Streptomyces xiamenensis TaxID=408015 RepID=UPI0035D64BED
MTDQITTCELCGRDELRGTVQMLELDADGNAVEDHYYGTGCAAKAAGWTQREVKLRVRAADTARRDAEQAARDAERREKGRRFDAWLLQEFGTTDRDRARRAAGFRTPFRLVQMFEAAERDAVSGAAGEWEPQQLTMTGTVADAQQGSLF